MFVDEDEELPEKGGRQDSISHCDSDKTQDTVIEEKITNDATSKKGTLPREERNNLSLPREVQRSKTLDVSNNPRGTRDIHRSRTLQTNATPAVDTDVPRPTGVENKEKVGSLSRKPTLEHREKRESLPRKPTLLSQASLHRQVSIYKIIGRPSEI